MITISATNFLILGADIGQFLKETQKYIYQTGGAVATISYPPIMATGNNRTFLALLAPGGPNPG